MCSVQSGKPKERLQWIKNTTVVKEGGQYGTITYRLNASLSDHMTKFICSAMNEALYHPITKQVRLDVLGLFITHKIKFVLRYQLKMEKHMTLHLEHSDLYIWNAKTLEV